MNYRVFSSSRQRMSFRIGLAGTTCIALLLLAVSCKPRPAAGAKGAVVTFLSGKADFRIKSGAWKALKVQDLLQGNAEIRTGDKTTLDLLASNSVGIRLLAGSNFKLASVLRDNVNLDVSGGNILVKVGKMRKGQSLVVETPTAIASVRGTQFWGQVNPKNKAGVFAVREGKVSISLKGSGKTAELSAGEAVEYDPDGTTMRKRKAKPAEMGAMKQIDRIRMSPAPK